MTVHRKTDDRSCVMWSDFAFNISIVVLCFLGAVPLLGALMILWSDYGDDVVESFHRITGRVNYIFHDETLEQDRRGLLYRQQLIHRYEFPRCGGFNVRLIRRKRLVVRSRFNGRGLRSMVDAIRNKVHMATCKRVQAWESA